MRLPDFLRKNIISNIVKGWGLMQLSLVFKDLLLSLSQQIEPAENSIAAGQLQATNRQMKKTKQSKTNQLTAAND